MTIEEVLVNAAILLLLLKSVVKNLYVYFMVAPCLNNTKHFIVQLMHTNYKILRLLK